MKPQIILYYLYFLNGCLVLSVFGQNCSTIPEFASCSTNTECGCFRPMHHIDQLCGLLPATCPDLTPCGGTNQDLCFLPGHVCIRFPRCFSHPVCYPLHFASESACPPLPPMTTSIETTATTTPINDVLCKNECRNGGTCSGPNTCSCVYGWRGPTCEEHHCPLNCLNGGICAGPNSCQCSNGWVGSRCEKYVCQSICQNGGTCVGPNQCACYSGWQGSRCETYYCSPYCQNGGTCIGPNNCRCPNKYYGSYCQSKDSCYNGKDFVHLVDGGIRRIEDLKLGDRVWSIDPYHPDKLVEDEIIMMAHLEPNATTEFFTFYTVDGDQVSLTGLHTIPVFDSDRNETKIIRSEKVTLNDQLILHGRTVPIQEIRKNIQLGFYSPLTMTSYLLVNNISTSVFSDSYQASQEKVHLVLGPLRLYYRLTRYIFGSNYQPFTPIQKGLHPIIASYKKHQAALRMLVEVLPYTITFVLATFVLLLIPKLRKQTKNV